MAIENPFTQATIPHEPTNTLALILPHHTLFTASAQQLLRTHYEHFGRIAHWGPIKSFGRVIVVFETEEEAEVAKRDGDWLRLKVAVNSVDGVDNAPESTELVLRLYYLPPTVLHPDPSTTHLAPPPLPHNFLISPPGSPPEGWEPTVEDAPNRVIFPEDLQRALEALELSGGRGDGKNVILEEGGVRVQVEDTSRHEVCDVQDTEELLLAGSGAWSIPSQAAGTSPGNGTPGYGIKIAPTARPPV
ncbi:uncharacterized protein L203_104880 [Cryptococcus depauperatus CBS 7841]|uniref:Uncharacterized protein n=1 Tax=Cryptococcus depauperatus CBS 7841 TaxID=1295531 RepID=A0A1E3IPY2_9TREE|nr:calcineurin-binding protein [Cryptococcus depauperatus CBS 7841]ODN96133.1 calcineurin-binding protein [Cryptococcus depauperatus CBS 7855]